MNRSTIESQKQILHSAINQQSSLNQLLNRLQSQHLQLQKQHAKIAPLKQLIVAGSYFESLLTRVLEQCQQFKTAQEIQRSTLSKQKVKLSECKQLKTENDKIRDQLSALQRAIEVEKMKEINLAEQKSTALSWMGSTEECRKQWVAKNQELLMQLQQSPDRSTLQKFIEISQTADPNIERQSLTLLEDGKVEEFLARQFSTTEQLELQLRDLEISSAEQAIALRDQIRDHDQIHKKYAHILNPSEKCSREDLQNRQSSLQTEITSLEDEIKKIQHAVSNVKDNMNELAKRDALLKTKYTTAPKRKEIQKSKAVIYQMLPLLQTSPLLEKDLTEIKQQMNELQNQESYLSNFLSGGQ